MNKGRRWGGEGERREEGESSKDKGRNSIWRYKREETENEEITEWMNE